MGFTVHIQLSEPIHFSVREGISSLLARDECRIENFTTTFPKRLRKSSRSSDILQLPFENYQNRSAGPERGFLNPLHLLRRGELMPGAVRASISIPLLPDLRSHNHLGQGWHSLEGTRQRGGTKCSSGNVQSPRHASFGARYGITAHAPTSGQQVNERHLA